MRVLKESFNAGVFSPRLHSRYELAKYKNGCKTLTNFIPTPHGTVTRRPGIQYVAEVKTSSKFTRLIPFEFSEEDSYAVEFGDQYCRFFRNGGQIQSVDSDTKLLLHFDGINNSTTITDDGNTVHSPTANGNAKIKTAAKKFGSAALGLPGGDSDNVTIPDHADWDMGTGTVTIDAWINIDSQPSSIYGIIAQYDDATNYMLWYYTSGGILNFKLRNGGTLLSLASTPSFSIDTWYHIAVVRGWGGNANDWAMIINGESVDTATDSITWPNLTSTLDIGKYSASPSGNAFSGYIEELRVSKAVARWTANFSPPTSQYPFGDDSGTVYEIATTYIEEDLPNLHFVQSADTMYIVHKDYVVRKLTRSGHASWAIANVTFTNAPAAWSANDYPRTIEFYEDRLCFGGSPDQPDTIWMTEVGAYTTFTVTPAAADDSITLTLAARKVNDIKWLSATRRLLAGTVGEEWWVSGPSDTEPIAFNNKVAKADSANGSLGARPVNIGDIVFYLHKSGKIVYEMAYDFGKDKYVSSNISILSEHLTKTYDITDMAYQKHPHSILWCVRSDGKLIALTYLKEHDVVAWSLHDSGSGEFESVAVIPGDPEDEVWFVVKRTVDGSVVRYVERMKPFNFGSDLQDAFFVDSGLTYGGAAATTISGLDHLEGESVAVLADGVVVTGKTVSSGSITLSTAASKVHVGLAYTPEIETLDALVSDDSGPLAGLPGRITNVSLRLIDSQGGLFGPDSTYTDEIPYDDTTSLFTGWTDDLGFNEGSDKTSTVYLKCDKPLPLEIAAILIDLED